MTPGTYSLISALNARWTQQESSANNLSGSSIIGHKRQITAFEAFDHALNTSAGEDPAHQLSAPTVNAQPTAYDWSSGASHPTGNNLDAAINGKGFFVIQTAAGPRLTRNGHFSLSATNKLVNDAGLPVMGQQGAITLPPGDASIQPDGTIQVSGTMVATLSIVAPKQPELMKSDGGGMFDAGISKTQPVKAALIPGSLESSNVEVTTEMVGMIQNQRMYDMLTRAFQMQDDSTGKAIQDLSGTA